MSTLSLLAARLVTDQPPVDGLREPPEALLELLKENRYPLLGLMPHPAWNWFYRTENFKRENDAHEALLSSLESDYSGVQASLVNEGISPVLIKAAPAFPYTSDNLDVLVRPEQEAKARLVLTRLGYIELKIAEEPQKFLFARVREGRITSKLHLHTRIGWGVGFMDEGALWQRVRPYGATMVPAPEDIVLITVAHSFYENKRFTLTDLMKLRCCAQGGLDFDYMERVARSRGWGEGLYFCLLLWAHLEERLWGHASLPEPSIESWKTRLSPLALRYYRRLLRREPVLPFRVSFLFSKLLYYKKVWEDRKGGLWAKPRDTVLTLVRGVKVKGRLHFQPPFLVTFSGADGTGKTQHAMALVSAMSECVKAEYFWSRCASSGPYRLLRGAGRLLLRRGDDGSRPWVDRKVSLSSPLRRAVWVYLVVLDLLWQYSIHVRLPMLRGRVVVCDRYAWDAAAELEASLAPGDWASWLAIRLLLALSPRPNMSFLLQAPNPVLAQRKQEQTDPRYLSALTEAYQRLARAHPFRVNDTGGDFAPLSDEITRETLACYMDRYHTLLNGLFLSNPAQLNPRPEGRQ
ncbi:MAG: nucleotidyltransferase family protein [Chloroflexi bacterium]|nr:nucleotidyltransferase family protein [Chloroflexota bacterium]